MLWQREPPPATKMGSTTMEYNKTIYYCIMYKSNNIFEAKTMTYRRYCLTKNYTPIRDGNYQKPYAIHIWQQYTITKSTMYQNIEYMSYKLEQKKALNELEDPESVLAK